MYILEQSAHKPVCSEFSGCLDLSCSCMHFLSAVPCQGRRSGVWECSPSWWAHQHRGKKAGFPDSPGCIIGTSEEWGFPRFMSFCLFIDSRRHLLELGGIFLFSKHQKQLPMLFAEHMIAIKINKCGQGSLLLVPPLLFLLLDALNSGHFCCLWQQLSGYHIELLTRNNITEPGVLLESDTPSGGLLGKQNIIGGFRLCFLFLGEFPQPFSMLGGMLT